MGEATNTTLTTFDYHQPCAALERLKRHEPKLSMKHTKFSRLSKKIKKNNYRLNNVRTDYMMKWPCFEYTGLNKIKMNFTCLFLLFFPGSTRKYEMT